ncbi:MAG: hypothetical protein VX278_02895 [Myxococcota bacterium]|nr:hypothetical protein [Myxococcota bacterium]
MATVPEHSEIDIRYAEPLSRHTPLRVGGNALAWVWVYSQTALVELLQHLRKQQQKWMISWPFQDLIFRDGGYDGVVIRLCGEFEKISYTKDSIKLGSAALWANVDRQKGKHLCSWSGSIGGLIDSNQANLLKGLRLEMHWLKGKKRWTEVLSVGDAMEAKDKKAILLHAEIFYPLVHKRKTPFRCGAIFSVSKAKTAQVFEKHNLCGIRLKSWLLSTHAPGQMIHLGNGRCSDLLLLSKGLKEQLKKSAGKKLDIRIPILGKEKKDAGKKR